MPQQSTNVTEALEELKAEQVSRYRRRPEPDRPQTPAGAYAAALDAARSEHISIDAKAWMG